MVHDDQPFRVVGILARTGTPVDRTVHVSLQSLEAIHADWQHGVRIPQRRSPAEAASAHGHEHDDTHGDHGRDVHVAPATATPQTVTAVFVGLKNRAAAFTLQRQINGYTGEPLLAIMPAMTLAQLWSLVGVAESALLLVAMCVVIAGLLGMTTALVTTLNERRREMAILRAIGARPWQVAALLLIESGTIALAGCLTGLLVVVALLMLLAPSLSAQFGLLLHPLAFTLRELVLLLAVLGGGLIAGLVPALLAWRRSLADGLTIRI
jgi:putative ABC transport system permease protein